jgi:basic membrane protein A
VLDTGGVDDRSFNAAAWAGVQRAKAQLGVDGRYVESKSEADYKTNLTQYANQGYDVIFAVGYKMEDALKEVAPQFPKIKFAIVDGNAPSGAPNCAALQFKEQEGTFLAGYLAASMSKTKKIGFVGGEKIDLIEKFEAGYRAGAKTADPGVQVLSAYTGDWNDLEKGKSQAVQEFGNGADIVFHAAGKAGLGVIQAAQEKGPGFYAIGVDRDQDDVAPGRVLTSMVKKLDNAVFDTVQRLQQGQFTPGTHIYDLKENGVGLSEMKYTKKDVPPAVLANLERLSRMIADGQITPPTKLDAVAAFQPPKL